MILKVLKTEYSEVICFKVKVYKLQSFARRQVLTVGTNKDHASFHSAFAT